MEFIAFPKINRLSRQIVITEKLDGTNAIIAISDDGQITAGSRNRWLTVSSDNYGFARWVDDNKEELLKLGPGYHYGEWWGKGIQRGYNLTEKRFSLFNVGRWTAENKPSCCHVVPIIWQAEWNELDQPITTAMLLLKNDGSYAAPGFMNPEGIIVYHVASNTRFKKTFEKDQGKEV